MKELEKIAQARPALSSINTKRVAVACRHEVLEEAAAFYGKRYDHLPVFYIPDSGKAENITASGINVRGFDALSSSTPVHIFTSLHAQRAGHSGISFLVRKLAEKGICNPSVEAESIERFMKGQQPETFSQEDMLVMQKCCDAFADKESKDAFLGVCKARMLGDSSYIPFASYPQYFHPKVPFQNGDIVCEGGICDGKTSVKFAKCVGDTGRIYGFEPVPECFAVSTKRTDRFSTIHLENKALWRKEESLSLIVDDPSSGYSHVGPYTGAGVLQCEATSIDAYFAESPPTVIKLDVEGAEIPVLEGALKTIRTHRPRLLLSIYHLNNGKDLLNIPKFLLDLDLDYALYVGHHSIWFNETILYAVPR